MLWHAAYMGYRWRRRPQDMVGKTYGKVSPVLFFTEHHTMKAYWGSGCIAPLHAFLTSALHGGELSASHPRRFTTRKRAPGIHWIGGWLGGPQSRSGHGVEEKNSRSLPRLEPPNIQPVVQRYITELPQLLIWWVAAYILNKQQRKADKGWSSSLGVRRRANNNTQRGFLRNVTQGLGITTCGEI
jgi:hypothetical protein